MAIKDDIKQLREHSKKRNFIQTFDLIINLKNINLKNPENKISKELVLPHGRGKEIKICIIGEKEQINRKKLEELARNKKAAKAFSKKYDFFLAEAPLMPIVGKTIGRFLGPKGKMPKPIAPNVDKAKLIELAKKSVRISVKTEPTIKCPVGTEQMEDEKIEENIKFVLKNVESMLPKGKSQIKDILLKLTMSKPVKLSFK